MYFPIFILHGWGNRSAVQPQTIYSEVPKLSVLLNLLKERVPSYVIFNNATLSEMARKKPHNLEELLEVSGVGQSKAKKYGKHFLKLIDEYLKTGPQ